MKTIYIAKPKPPMDLLRPLSWSAIASFTYSPEQWYLKYIMGEEQPPSDEMIFGKQVGEMLATDPTYLPEVPRLPVFEHELRFTFNGIPMLGYIDALDIEKRKLFEYKTGRKKWDQKRVDQHGQIDMYNLGLWVTAKIRPEEMNCELIWMPTHLKDGIVMFVDPFKPKRFKANRSMADILRFGQKIIDTRAKMIDYYEHHP